MLQDHHEFAGQVSGNLPGIDDENPAEIIPESLPTADELLYALDLFTSSFQVKIGFDFDGNRQIIVSNYYGTRPLVIPALDLVDALRIMNRLVSKIGINSVENRADPAGEEVRPPSSGAASLSLPSSPVQVAIDQTIADSTS